mmetsp:Transcript_31889/g.63161  ORF Transcript_31889/g.63161 Transcript_31889/m.63161 type:complete len:283 (-) Transcript_31889:2072-2920(-)
MAFIRCGLETTISFAGLCLPLAGRPGKAERDCGDLKTVGPSSLVKEAAAMETSLSARRRTRLATAAHRGWCHGPSRFGGVLSTCFSSLSSSESDSSSLSGGDDGDGRVSSPTVSSSSSWVYAPKSFRGSACFPPLSHCIQGWGGTGRRDLVFASPSGPPPFALEDRAQETEEEEEEEEEEGQGSRIRGHWLINTRHPDEARQAHGPRRQPNVRSSLSLILHFILAPPFPTPSTFHRNTHTRSRWNSSFSSRDLNICIETAQLQSGHARHTPAPAPAPPSPSL